MTVAALVSAVLLVAVRLRWGPLEAADHGAAAWINGLVAAHPAVVGAVTWLGSDGAACTVLGLAAAVLAASGGHLLPVHRDPRSWPPATPAAGGAGCSWSRPP
ncbi:MAG TPA: hypothetical protein VMH35_13450 [Streptosporangiaceae bacterium]|nr:hypothetical protein [Streptosporangiaceae bacterium]